jgi:hypothetical protein
MHHSRGGLTAGEKRGAKGRDNDIPDQPHASIPEPDELSVAEQRNNTGGVNLPVNANLPINRIHPARRTLSDA